jgi:putative membrane-bound dehydrogenase-like protein
MHKVTFACFILCLSAPWAAAQSEYGFINTRPSAQPYLSPEESLKRMQVPPGFEVKLFAAEPDIINPISFTVDERGRLWVVECYEYPKRAPKDRPPRDRIKILEDTTGSGRADKVTIWAEGKDLPHFDLASGIEVGHGGVFLGAAPYLFFLRDSKGTGRCDHCDILLSGFGSQDTHETLNTLQWGPDGQLYGLHGIFTQSKVGEVQLNAAIWRYQPEYRKFEIFAEGTSNPWGLDFDPHGQAFLTACVIPHAFHVVPGGVYIRQAGNSANPYAYGFLREICDHTHHAESGWAHAGALVLQGDHIPHEYLGSLLMGSIHGCQIKRDTLERKGSSYLARHAPDFLVSGDKNFRPVNLRWGPDGSIYVIDWHDQNPCHQAHPDSWDMTHGRIYKIQRTGTKAHPADDLARKSSADLVSLLKGNDPWSYRTALRLLSERKDASIAEQLRDLVRTGGDEQTGLRALWALHGAGSFDDSTANDLLKHPSVWIRAWTIRLLAGHGHVPSSLMGEFVQLAVGDKSADVRLQLAASAQQLPSADAVPILHALMEHVEDAEDPCIPFMIWLAYEPHLAAASRLELRWLAQRLPNNPLVEREILPRAVRRLVATGRMEDMSECVRSLGGMPSAARRIVLDAFLIALRDRPAEQPPTWKTVFPDLLNDSDTDVRRMARRLAVKFRDPEAVRRSIACLVDKTRPSGERIDAAADLGDVHPAEALKPMEKALLSEKDPRLLSEVCRSLTTYQDREIGPVVLSGWRRLPPSVRVEAVNLLAGRKEWAGDLLTAVARKDVDRNDLNDQTILRMRALHDPELDRKMEAVWGRVRDRTPAELEGLIVLMRKALYDGKGSFQHGRQVFDTQCAKCHQFEGRGHNVGPSLDGAARDIEYLLVNVLDPNRVVGQPYYLRFVTLKNGRVETGLLASEDDRSITLKAENDALTVLQKKDIEEIAVQEKSLMPEGLNKNMTVQDFRDLIRYLMMNPFLADVETAGPFLGQTATPDPSDHLKRENVKWNRATAGPPGRISLPPAYGDSTTYISAEILAREPISTRLSLGCGHSVDAWLNGKLVYSGKPGAAAAPDQASTEITFKEGSNRLLLRVRYRGTREAIFARFADPGRKLSYPELKN